MSDTKNKHYILKKRKKIPNRKQMTFEKFQIEAHLYTLFIHLQPFVCLCVWCGYFFSDFLNDKSSVISF